MAGADRFRVIIAGGGLAGLTLANALEKADIDYVLLEARNTIAPSVGASIGIFPNGGRILDQLGCFDEISKEGASLVSSRMRDRNGVSFSLGDSSILVAARANYASMFLEREVALRILYENLQSKSRINLQKKISVVDHTQNGVTVTCEDGTSISGDVLIGCDGVHSVVRNEMWRLAHLHDQTSFSPSDKDLLFAEYKCLFGISTAINGIADGELSVNYDQGFSTMVVGGKQKIFWFVFKKMDKIW
ncbi:hypothetical protein E8E13_010417 [Curvularia kusanoi]|uniref:FAD-binding domain-containing protein n=1 Tax=Curvularia kusanoi TaxID=90978 RepID=A0A9P4WB35_CURKU|nr:hypothetical protein E8E13_010417 [Curvularia kusanoi]